MQRSAVTASNRASLTNTGTNRPTMIVIYLDLFTRFGHVSFPVHVGLYLVTSNACVQQTAQRIQNLTLPIAFRLMAKNKHEVQV